MRVLLATFALCLGIIAIEETARAAEDCSLALAKDTISDTTNELRSLAIAWSLTKEEYENLGGGGGGSASYGPYSISGSYSSFREMLRRRIEEYGFNSFEQYARAYSTSGLSDNSLQAYLGCLAKGNGGLALELKQSSGNFYFVAIKYDVHVNPGSPDGSMVPVPNDNVHPDSFNTMNEILSEHHFTMPLDDVLVVVPVDKRSEATISVKVGGASRSILLPPLERGKTIRMRVTGTMDYQVENALKRYNLNWLTADFNFVVPREQLSGPIKKYFIKIDQLVNGVECASGVITNGAQNFGAFVPNGGNDIPEFVDTFSGGGMSGTIGPTQHMLIFLDPKRPELCS